MDLSALPLRYAHPLTLVGGGALDAAMLAEARAIAPNMIAADGAADRLAEFGVEPLAVIGDMDSIRAPEDWRGGPVPYFEISDQNSTDFEKCLISTEAPFYLAAGFTGRRIDHMLAVFHAMLGHRAKTIILIGEQDVIALLPPGRTVAFQVAKEARVSLFPLLPATGVVSTGLFWPVEGLAMAPGTQIGTSNIAVAERVEIAFDAPGMLLFLERSYLRTLVEALVVPIGDPVSNPAR